MYSEKRQSQLIGFLWEELNVSDSFILLALRLRKYKLEPISILMILKRAKIVKNDH